MELCVVDDCGRTVYCKGRCRTHYKRLKRGGSDQPIRSYIRGIDERLLAYTDRTGDCWLWLNCLNEAGYGIIRWDGKNHLAHRASWLRAVGPIPDGMVLDHMCRVRKCINPEHLRVVTDQVNIADGLKGFNLTGRCRSGQHDVTDPSSIYVAPNGDRRCYGCMRAAEARRPPRYRAKRG